MKIIETVREMQSLSDGMRDTGRRIGFVPTMGYLHKGHLSLVHRAKELCDWIVVSIFVNPTQFGPNEDFNRYPRSMDRDRELLEVLGVDVLFTPSVAEMYPEGYVTYVAVERLTERLEGNSRPGHFRGVTTVVTKLFNAVKPHVAVFGQKDAQQGIVIRRMVRDLNFDIDIVVAPTIREESGLALSSRNVYLSPDEQKQALVLYQSLQEAERLIHAGERRTGVIVEYMRKMISAKPAASIDYISITRVDALEPVEVVSGEVLVSLAVKIGTTRLIDNIVVRV